MPLANNGLWILKSRGNKDCSGPDYCYVPRESEVLSEISLHNHFVCSERTICLWCFQRLPEIFSTSKQISSSIVRTYINAFIVRALYKRKSPWTYMRVVHTRRSHYSTGSRLPGTSWEVSETILIMSTHCSLQRLPLKWEQPEQLQDSWRAIERDVKSVGCFLRQMVEGKGGLCDLMSPSENQSSLLSKTDDWKICTSVERSIDHIPQIFRMIQMNHKEIHWPHWARPGRGLLCFSDANCFAGKWITFANTTSLARHCSRRSYAWCLPDWVCDNGTKPDFL